MPSGQRPHPLGDRKSLCTKSCVLWFVTTFVLRKFLCNAFLRHFRPKTELTSQGRGHTRGPILLICNTDRDFYHIRSHTKFGWASSIIFWVMVATDRQTDRQTDRHRQTDTDRQTQTDTDRQTDRQTDRRYAKNTFFGFSGPQNVNIYQNLEVDFLGKCNTFSILRIAEKVKMEVWGLRPT